MHFSKSLLPRESMNMKPWKSNLELPRHGVTRMLMVLSARAIEAWNLASKPHNGRFKETRARMPISSRNPNEMQCNAGKLRRCKLVYGNESTSYAMKRKEQVLQAFLVKLDELI